MDRAKRKIETELQDVKEQLAEKKAQVDELQIVLSEFSGSGGERERGTEGAIVDTLCNAQASARRSWRWR